MSGALLLSVVLTIFLKPGASDRVGQSRCHASPAAHSELMFAHEKASRAVQETVAGADGAPAAD
jgi:hypothetical protein